MVLSSFRETKLRLLRRHPACPQAPTCSLHAPRQGGRVSACPPPSLLAAGAGFLLHTETAFSPYPSKAGCLLHNCSSAMRSVESTRLRIKTTHACHAAFVSRRKAQGRLQESLCASYVHGKSATASALLSGSYSQLYVVCQGCCPVFQKEINTQKLFSKHFVLKHAPKLSVS